MFARHFSGELTLLLRKLGAKGLLRSKDPEAPRGKSEIKWVDKDGVYSVQHGLADPETWSARDVYHALCSLTEAELAAVEAHASVHGLVITILSVMETPKRPYLKAGGEWKCGEVTGLYTHIVAANNKVRDHRVRGDLPHAVASAVSALQLAVSTLYDASSSQTANSAPASRKAGSIITGIKGKKGRIRRCLTGKRVDFSARSVISCDSALALDEIGIPYSVAGTLAYPEAVTEANRFAMRELVRSGEGWSSLTTQGNRFMLQEAEARLRDLAQGLVVGDVVYRGLRNGDVVLFNRQPTLHRMGIMAFRVRLLPWSTFRVNPNIVLPFNGDFDGDETNIHAPQTPEAAVEAAELVAVGANLLSPNGQVR